MTTLESYLTGDVQRDRSDITAIETVLRETASTIAATFERTHWPYEVTRGAARRVSGLSHSTTAMMIRAIDVLLGASGGVRIDSSYELDLDDNLKKELKAARRSALDALFKALQPSGTGVRTLSRTYGWNDPLTLSFLAEICLQDDSTPHAIRQFIQAETTRYMALDPAKEGSKFFDYTKPSKRDGEEGDVDADMMEFERSTPLTNAFIPLRVLRTCRVIGVDPPHGYQNHLRYFESTLHDQLSFVSIPDSRFDPAELAFCLEGILRSSQTSDVALFRRVLEVLRTAQESSAHWRPTKPFLRSERGMVLFPVSVEAANALLRSCRLLDGDSRFDRFTEDVVRLLRRFWEWLSARRISFAENGGKLSGWHSEHVADIDSIQLWDTAQVVEFLLGYWRRLHVHIARTTLHLSRFSVRPPGKPKAPWSETTGLLQPYVVALSSSVEGSKRGASEASEDTITQQFEPVTTLGPRFEIYRRIGEDFMTGWLGHRRTNYSMLLYGPPGTGKTSIAENIADALQFPLITITVSDFLAEGGGAVEARAKMIFEVLEAQADCVVLFDEIDELLLDRSSARHGKQETVFQFMTPGMLTKLNNLRHKQRVIFILATNYAYRIDPAIRRTGRIDVNYLLLPPDAIARKQMLLSFFKKVLPSGASLPPEKDLDLLSKTALFLGYKDMQAAVARVSREGPLDANKLGEVLEGWARTTSLDFYRSAFSEVVDTRAIESEFLPLVQMAIQEDPNYRLPSELKNFNGTPVFESAEAMTKAARDFVSTGKLTEGGE